ncbi:hypothetical protein DSL72_002243 [Monilinia vaccinii-corymbosi]|uniref:Uncharacterized protein n=1 Tax=Monilinia vaccinii-corymbosi TaxID=61207 RepID=A0A8A3PC21_9HELO|nr:hypothetical protein DSL72_002243 [Monilinia vaccinii-corymbosi]
MRVGYGYRQGYGDTRPTSREENDKTLRKHWTKIWIQHQIGVQDRPEIEWGKEFATRLENQFPLMEFETLRDLERAPIPRRDSMDPRERGAAIIRELLYFYPPVMNEIVKGMDRFESCDRDTANQYINQAQREIDEELKKADK